MMFALRAAGLLALAAGLLACGDGAHAPASAPATAPQAAAPLAAPLAAPARTPLTGARGLHMAANFSAYTEQALRQAIGTRLASGGTLAAGSVSALVVANLAGGTVTSELAQVRLTGVRLSSGATLPVAGFWLGRDTASGNLFLQLRPSLDANLAGVAGFHEDITVSLTPAGELGTPADGAAEGAALQLAADVLASAPALLQAATVQLGERAGFDKPQLVQAAERIRAAAAAQRDAYFDSLARMNAGWVGMSVALFVDSVSDPTVRARVRIPGRENEIATWSDDDLLAFMARARERGVQVYLTLAFEQPFGDAGVPVAPGDARCNTPQAPVPRYVMGNPNWFAGGPFRCIAQADWWWSPAHPQHAAKKAAFWQSYTQQAAHFAQIAQQGGAALYSLGTETDWLFRTRPSTAANAPNHFLPELQQMVAAVRAAYTGRVTYDQHIKVFTDPGGTIAGGDWGWSLAPDLGFDVIGLSTYVDAYPAAPTQVLSVAELETSFWKPVFDNVIAPLRAANPGRPIVFTEVGVVDDLGVPHDQASNVGLPVAGRDANGITPGMRQQANLYAALMNVNAARGRPVQGMFFWALYMLQGSDAGSSTCELVTHHIACSPPARDAVAAGYAGWLAADAQRVFDWAERALAAIFPQGTGQAGSALGYTYRYYPASQTFLASKDGHIHVHNGRDWVLLDVGPVASFLEAAAAAGF